TIRHVQVFAKALFAGHHADEFIRSHIRIAVEEPYPFQGINLYQLAQQSRDALGKTEIFTISHGVLGHDYQLAHPLLCKTPRFSHKIRDAAAPKAAAKTRNRAKRADV